MITFYFDLSRNRLTAHPSRASALDFQFKRGDTLQLKLILFNGLDDGGNLIPPDVSVQSPRFGVRAKIGSPLLVFGEFNPTNEPSTWVSSIVVNSEVLVAAFGVGDQMQAAISAIAEVTFIVPQIGNQTCQTFAVKIENDIIRDGETAPTVDPAAAAFRAAIAAVVTAETQGLATQDALTMERDARILADTNEANARVQSLNAEASVRAAAITAEAQARSAGDAAEAQARSAGDADALSKNNGGTVMGTTTFAGRVQVTQPPTQPNDVPRWQDVDVVRERKKHYTIPVGQTVAITISPADVGNKNLINGVYTGYIEIFAFYNSSYQYSAHIKAAYQYWTPSLTQFSGGFNGVNTPEIKSANETLTLTNPDIVNGLLTFNATNHHSQPMPFTVITKLYENAQ